MSSIFQIEVVVRSGVMISQVWHDCKRLRRLTGADVRFCFNGHLFVYSGQPLQALIADYHARLRQGILINTTKQGGNSYAVQIRKNWERD